MEVVIISQLPEKHRKEVVELTRTIYAGYAVWDLDYVRTTFLEWVRLQAVKLAMLEGIDRIDSGQIDGIDDIISRAVAYGTAPSHNLRFKRDATTWLTIVAEEEKIPTGIFHVDAMLGGGGARGEVGVLVAPPNYGKSMGLVNIGYGAAGYVSQSNVGHVSLEMSEYLVSSRYGARATFKWFDGDVDTYKTQLLEATNRRMYGDIDILGGSPGMLSGYDLRRYLERLLRDDFPVDCLIVDYADLMKLPKGDTAFERHGENYTLLKQIAKDYDLMLWTASQTTRSSLRKLTIDLDDIAESFQKAARADIVLAWCQTPEEEDDHEMRWFCAKNRAGLKHWYVKCKLHDTAHAVVSQEILWGSDLIKKKAVD
jgi:hypothetical protein